MVCMMLNLNTAVGCKLFVHIEDFLNFGLFDVTFLLVNKLTNMSRVHLFKV